MAHCHYHHHHHHHHLTISLNLVNLRCRCSVKFSLSGRDGDSNRFLSSWRGIPNTNPTSPIRVAIKSPLVQLRRKKRKVVGMISAAQSENNSAKGDRDYNPPLGLRQWLSIHPYCHPDYDQLLVIPA